MTNDQIQTDANSPVQIPDAVRNAPSLSVPETGRGEVQPSTQAILESHHSDFAEFHEGYVRHYIALADTKAAWAFAIVSALFVYLLGTDDIRDVLLKPERSCEFASLAGAIVFLLVSGFFSFMVIAPRLASKSGDGIVFFGAVAARQKASVYVADVAKLDASELTEVRLRHCYDVSAICTRKYGALKKAIWFGLPALALSLLTTLLIG